MAMDPIELETPRLRLRQWRDEDVESLYAMTSDPEVQAHFPSVQDRDKSLAMFDKLRELIDEKGWGFWAVEIKAGRKFAGFCGLKEVSFDAPFVPAVEVGWRFARDTWGHGYATEAGRASIRFGFDELGLDEIVAFLLPGNRRSAAVCERLGMARDEAGDFDHPWFDADARAVNGQPLQRHALYRLKAGTASPAG